MILEKAQSLDLYRAVKRLILDPKLRQQLGAAAWERVQELRWDRAVKSLSHTYEQWLAEHRRAVEHPVELPFAPYSSPVGSSVIIKK